MQTKHMSVIAGLAFGLLLGGCHHAVGRSNLAQPAAGVAVFDMDATRRGIVVVRTPDTRNEQGETVPGRILTCPEAPPDVALETVRQITANLTAAVGEGRSGSVDIARSLQESVRQLSPTSEATTFLRSTLAEICWISTNVLLNQVQSQAVLTAAIEASRQLAMRQVALDLLEVLRQPVAAGEDPQVRVQLVRALQLVLIGANGISRDQLAPVFQ